MAAAFDGASGTSPTLLDGQSTQQHLYTLTQSVTQPARVKLILFSSQLLLSSVFSLHSLIWLCCFYLKLAMLILRKINQSYRQTNTPSYSLFPKNAKISRLFHKQY